MKKITLLLITLISISLFSCASTPVASENLSPAQIIQAGQNAYEASDYKAALFYYNTAIDRFGSDPAIYVEATYEIGHIYFKTKKYAEAEDCFNEIISIYANYANNYGSNLPQQYNKLAKIELNKIQSKK